MNNYLDWLLREAYLRDQEAMTWADWVAVGLLAAVIYFSLS
jgi:hypothetical protein